MFNLLNPQRCPITAFMWELAKKESLPLPESAASIYSSCDGDQPIYGWEAENGDTVRLTINHFDMLANVVWLDSDGNELASYSFKLKLELESIG